MKVAGIVCEYNPFHNGHKYQIEKTRENGATHIVCAMSGNFVQRGDCSIADKQSRAKAAVSCGADLVIEIPTPWACSSAENFARGAVSLLSSIPIDFLSFGCETADKILLEEAAKAVDSPKIGEKVRSLIAQGNTYPTALQKAIGEAFGKEVSSVLERPNNTLAVEYIRQREKLAASFDFLSIERHKADHEERKLKNNLFASAGALRNVESIEEIKKYIPLEMYDELVLKESKKLYPCKIENADRVVIAALRNMTLDEMKLYIPNENGLAERVFSKSRNSSTTEELINAVKVKSITQAAVRRAVMLCFLGVPNNLAKGNPPYLKILAANKKGFEILKERKPRLPVITKKSEADRLSEKGKMIYELECRCTDKFSLFSKKIPGCSREQTSPIIIL